MGFSVARKALVREKGEVNIQAIWSLLPIGSGGEESVPSISTTKMHTTCGLSRPQLTNTCPHAFPRGRPVVLCASIPKLSRLLSSKPAYKASPLRLPQFHLLISHKHLPWDLSSPGNAPPPLMHMDTLLMPCPQWFILEDMSTNYEGRQDYRPLYTVTPYLARSPHHLVYPRSQVYLTSYPGSTFTAAHIEPPRVPQAQRKPYFTRLLLNDANPLNRPQNRMTLNQTTVIKCNDWWILNRFMLVFHSWVS